MAILEGIAGGFLFWATGVSSPILFGILMAIFSVIPPVGSGLVWFPVGIMMILFGHPLAGGEQGAAGGDHVFEQGHPVAGGDPGLHQHPRRSD